MPGRKSGRLVVRPLTGGIFDKFREVVAGHRVQVQDFPLKPPGDFVKGADMGPDLVGLVEGRFRIVEPCSVEAARVGEKSYADDIVCLAGKDQLERISKQHKIVNGIGYFKNFDLVAPFIFSPVFIEMGGIDFDQVPDLVHQVLKTIPPGFGRY